MNFITMKGSEARGCDPDHIQWPDSSLVVYAFDGDSVVGRSAIIDLPHIEGTWVANEKRGTTLAYRLINHLEREIKAHNRTHAFAFAMDDQPEVSEYLDRIGYRRFPVTVWMKEL